MSAKAESIIANALLGVKHPELTKRVLAALKAVNEEAGNAGYKDSYYDCEPGDPIWDVALKALLGDA